MAFEDNKNVYDQEHFTIIEIDLPVVNGECTIGSLPGFGTPLTCDQPINGTKTYKFTTQSAPILPVSEVYRCITSISENTAELQSGRGLALSASLKIDMDDFKGDPNPLAPGVNAEVKQKATFFSKMNARYILQNRPIRIVNYRMVDGEMPDLATDGEIRHYVIDVFQSSGSGKWSILAKDELSKLEFGDKEWPPVAGGFLRQDIDETTTTLLVDPDVQYTADDFIRIGSEIFEVTAVLNIGTSSAQLTVAARSTGVLVGGITRTDVESHNAGDEIFVCRYYNDAVISEPLYDILTESDFPAAYIPLTEWANELDLWHRDTRIKMIFTEAMDSNEQLKRILTSYMIDMWFEPVQRLAKISAISAWRESVATLTEGVEINYDSIKTQPQEDLRATSAVVLFGKTYLARDDDVENYRRLANYLNPTLTTEAYYGEPKQKRFDNNSIIDSDAADLLTRRYVSRYGLTPVRHTWKTEENKLSFKVGDVVDLKTFASVDFDGSPNKVSRAQITQIRPMYKNVGRQYAIKSLTYDPAINTSTGDANDFVLVGQQSNVNLYNEAGGAIPEAVELTFIFDGIILGSSSTTIPAIRIGSFPAGSKITIICVNGADLQARGGDGGRGGTAVDGIGQEQLRFARPGVAGGVVLDANGIDVDIYLSGSTPSADYPEADGYLRAPGGGAGGFNATATNGGDGGNGGAGREGGQGGEGGSTNIVNGIPGISGADGTDNGLWGVDGAANGGGSGLAGKGIVKSGAAVTVYGATPTRLINGRGDSYDTGA